jgi:outer membrane protein
VAEAPAGPPPRALAPPGGDGARPPQTRIGLFNMTRALKASKKYQSLEADLRTRTQQVQERLEAMKTQLQKLQAECDNPATPANRREGNAAQVRQLKREMEDEEEKGKAILTKANGDALGTMYRDVEDVVNRVAKVNGLELVLFYTDAVTEADFYTSSNLQRKLTQPGALMPMIVAPGMDITETVIEALNRMHAPADDPRR